MSGAGGYKKEAKIPVVRVLTKAEIKEELRKVSGNRWCSAFECVLLHVRGR